MNYTKNDAAKVMAQIQTNDPKWGVRVSIDQEYFILTYDGEDVIHDSAAEDCYDIDAAAGMFQFYIEEHPRKISREEYKKDMMRENYNKGGEGMSLLEYVKTEAESDPGFFRWLFDDDSLSDFECPNKEEFNRFLSTFAERTATLRNLLTGQEVKVHATTDHPASSYGIPVWVDDDDNAYCQVGTIAPGYEITEEQG